MKISKSMKYFIAVALFLTTGWSFAATYTVTNLDDSGNGSLRWAIEQANANPGGDNVVLGVSGIISPASALPDLTDNGTIIGKGYGS